MKVDSRIGLPLTAILLSCVLFFFSYIHASAMDVTLEWDANAEPASDHYVVYWGTSSGNYNWNSGNIDKTTNTYEVKGLAANTKYYFVIKAVDSENNESADSREVCWIKHDHADNDGRDSEWEITSGDLKGFKFVFDVSGEIPTLGPSSEIPALNLSSVSPLGSPLNLQPSPTYFNTPVKIFIPCSGYSDLSKVDIYHYDDVAGKWLTMHDADDWVVAGSLEEHYETDPNTVAIEVKHFSGAQAGVPVSDSESGSSSGGGGCFIASTAR